MAINIGDLTQGIIEGNGAFDIMMKAQLAQLDAQLKKGRVTNDQYATIYPQLAMATMQAANGFIQAQQQAKQTDAQIEVLEAQKSGFEKDAMHKYMKSMMDIWNVRRTTDEGTEPNNQNRLTDVNIGNAVTAMAQMLNVPVIATESLTGHVSAYWDAKTRTLNIDGVTTLNGDLDNPNAHKEPSYLVRLYLIDSTGKLHDLPLPSRSNSDGSYELQITLGFTPVGETTVYAVDTYEGNKVTVSSVVQMAE